MAKSRVDKAESLKILVDGLKTSKSVVFANFQGLKVKESEELRNLCREQGVEYFVAKKTLVQKALEEAGVKIDTKTFSGGVSAVFGIKDEVAPAQVLAKFAKTHESVKFFGGILEGKFIAASEVDMLSKLPSKQQLLSQLVGTLNAPVSGFVNVLAGNLRGLVTVLSAVKEQKA